MLQDDDIVRFLAKFSLGILGSCFQLMVKTVELNSYFENVSKLSGKGGKCAFDFHLQQSYHIHKDLHQHKKYVCYKWTFWLYSSVERLIDLKRIEFLVL